MKRTLQAAARVLGGELIGLPEGADRPYSVVSSDSRTLGPGALFVALRGERFDGAEFVAAAAARGAVGAIVARASVDRAAPCALPQILVEDALRALQQLARGWRADHSIPIVAVGGSNGKTTTKEMTAAILSRSGPCLATHGNLNNHIGVPLTLMRLEPSHRSAVIEMGANRIGDVAELVTLARPTVGLITNAGAEHLEGFGDLDGVAKGEGEMVAGLGPTDTAIINADDAYAGYWRAVAAAGAHHHLRRARRGGFHRDQRSADDRARRVRHALHPQVSARRAGDHAQGRRRAQHRQRPRRGERGERRRRIAR